MPRLFLALTLASVLSFHGFRSKSLSPGGAAAAFFAGFASLFPRTSVFATALIAFYLTGSRATKYGKKRKANFEDGYHEAGYRSAFQVFSNSFSAIIPTIVWTFLHDMPRYGNLLLNGLAASSENTLYDPQAWCPITPDSTLGIPYSRVCVYAAVGHYACCLGDTLASELGILSSSSPILVTTLKPVPRGTNGAISLGGTLASLFGGLFVGFCAAIALTAESEVCRNEATSIFVQLLMLGAFGGAGGSMIDSFLGATIQRTRYSTRRGKILSDERPDGKLDADDKIIERGWNILTNNQVNMVSSLLVAVIAGYFAYNI